MDPKGASEFPGDIYWKHLSKCAGTSVGILHTFCIFLWHLGTGGAAAGFPITATAFDSSFAASLSACWIECCSLGTWNPNKHLEFSSQFPIKKGPCMNAYFLKSQTPNSTKWWSQLSHDPFRIQDTQGAWASGLPSAWLPSVFILSIGQSGLPNFTRERMCSKQVFHRMDPNGGPSAARTMSTKSINSYQ